MLTANKLQVVRFVCTYSAPIAFQMHHAWQRVDSRQMAFTSCTHSSRSPQPRLGTDRRVGAGAAAYGSFEFQTFAMDKPCAVNNYSGFQVILELGLVRFTTFWNHPFVLNRNRSEDFH